MHISRIDLNLLRLFDTVARTGNVSRAAELLGVTQPAASQGLKRLRALLGDALFTRTAAGMRPTPKAGRLAEPVRIALATLEQALNEAGGFEPRTAGRVFQVHMSDIGEKRFLPGLLAALQARAPGVRVEARLLPQAQIAQALNSGGIDFAFGFLPAVKETQRVELQKDRYIVLVRAGHPLARHAGRSSSSRLEALRQVEFVGVRSHADTFRILQQTGLEGRLRLVTEHFLVLPAIVEATDLAAIVPLEIACGFEGGYAVVDPGLPDAEFGVSLHWSRRFESDRGNLWFRELVFELFRQDPSDDRSHGAAKTRPDTRQLAPPRGRRRH